MKATILFIILSIALMSCDNRGDGEKYNIPEVDYIMQLTLVGGVVINDTISLYEGTKLEIGQYNGAYGLEISNYYPLYWNGPYIYPNAFIKWGVIEFKVINK